MNDLHKVLLENNHPQIDDKIHLNLEFFFVFLVKYEYLSMRSQDYRPFLHKFLLSHFSFRLIDQLVLIALQPDFVYSEKQVFHSNIIFFEISLKSNLCPGFQNNVVI